MIYLKSCPRCGGDVKKDKDAHGEFSNCLQCGWYGELSRDPLSQMALDELRTAVKLTFAEAS